MREPSDETTTDALIRNAGAAGLRQAMSWGTRIPWEDGGPDPLEVMVYADRRGWLLFVGLGLTECAEKRSDRPNVSGFGFELTMRLACPALRELDLDAETVDLFHVVPFWPVTVLNSLARYVFKSRRGFVHTDFMDMKNTPWRAPYLGFVDDEQLGSASTKNGSFTFRSVFPLADADALDSLERDGEAFVERLKQDDMALMWTEDHAPEPEAPEPAATAPQQSWWRRLFGK